MIESRRFGVWNSQRAADGGIAAGTAGSNGLMRAGCQITFLQMRNCSSP